jgi:heme/copper-type cytochrome/quinol oxidase subunit 2
MNSQGHPTTYRHSEMDHRRQKTWQIYVPIFIVIAIILATFILLLVSQNSSSAANIGNLSSISVIWLIFPMLGIGLAFLVMLAGFIYLTIKITKALPLYSLKVSTIFYQAALTVHRLADKSVIPVIKIQQIQAGLNSLFHRIHK